LFQYACGRALSLRVGAPLVLDVGSFDWAGAREYGLGNFAIQSTIAKPEEISAHFGRRSGVDHQSLWFRVTERCRPAPMKRLIVEEKFGFLPLVLRARPPVYLNGYWQSEKYFADQAESIRRELTLIAPPSAEVANAMNMAAAVESVCIHIRRGDYVRNGDLRRIHGVCGPDYYNNAADCILQRTNSPVFFVFSDDPVAARKEIHLPGETIWVGEQFDWPDIDHFRLMQCCRHHVIANSSFGWWAAWLGARDGQIVVGPRRWFRTTDRDDSAVLPERWIRV